MTFDQLTPAQKKTIRFALVSGLNRIDDSHKVGTPRFLVTRTGKSRHEVLHQLSPMYRELDAMLTALDNA